MSVRCDPPPLTCSTLARAVKLGDRKGKRLATSVPREPGKCSVAVCDHSPGRARRTAESQGIVIACPLALSLCRLKYFSRYFWAFCPPPTAAAMRCQQPCSVRPCSLAADLSRAPPRPTCRAGARKLRSFITHNRLRLSIHSSSLVRSTRRYRHDSDVYPRENCLTKPRNMRPQSMTIPTREMHCTQEDTQDRWRGSWAGMVADRSAFAH